MNIDAICKFTSTGYSSTIRCSNNRTLSSDIDGTSCRFLGILHSETTNLQMFEKHLKSLVVAFLSGYNACILCYGEANSGLNMLLSGSRLDGDGILKLLMLEIFRNISNDELSLNLQKEALSVHSFFIGSDGILDMVRGFGPTLDPLRMIFTINEGYQIEVLQETCIDSFRTAENVCTQVLKNYFSRICKTNQDFEDIPAGFFFRVNLNGEKLRDGASFRSKFTVVCLTGFEQLSQDMRNETEFGNSDLLTLYNLTFLLASGKPGVRNLPNYSASKLTKLLYDEIGGNCYTRIILCLSSNPNSETYTLLLRFTSQLTHITNAPVMNDDCALLLAAKARETQRLLEQTIFEQAGGIRTNLEHNDNTIQNVDPPFLRLKEHVHELSERLEKTQVELTHATDERVKLSKAWLLSEEDRMQVNEKLAQTELELQEVLLKNKQLQLLCEKDTEALKHVTELQKSNDMLNNYCTELKKKLEDLQEELTRMSIRNEELSRELLHQTVEQKSVLTFLASKNSNKMKELPRFEKELNRVEVMLSGESTTNGKEKFKAYPEVSTHKSKTNVNRNDNNCRLSKKDYSTPSDSLIQKTEDKMSSSAKNEKQTQSQILKYLSKCLVKMEIGIFSTLYGETDLIIKERDHLKSQLMNTNRNLARFLNDFRSRLIYHINGITRLVDATKSKDQIVAEEAVYNLEKYIKHLIADIQATYQIRENELIKIIRSLNSQYHAALKAVHKVMIYYTKLRTQAVQRGSSIRDPGPTPQELIDQLGLQLNRNTDFLLNLSSSVMAESTQPIDITEINPNFQEDKFQKRWTNYSNEM
ncbi:unnamed protein product [Heterobilharzia americana]|nr:unnamed protein product [Heterobilharzia americana]